MGHFHYTTHFTFVKHFWGDFSNFRDFLLLFWDSYVIVMIKVVKI
nr:MAG TPA: hypothetical protein [Caudoviricetes sp.]